MPGNKANSNGKSTQTRKVLGWRWWIHISWIQQTPTMHDFIFKPMKHIEAALAVRTWWEFTFRLEIQIILVRVSKAIYLVRLWWRRFLDCCWFHVCGGMSFTLSWGATTMQVNYGEKATGTLLLELLQLKKRHPATWSFHLLFGVVLGDYRSLFFDHFTFFGLFYLFWRKWWKYGLQNYNKLFDPYFHHFSPVDELNQRILGRHRLQRWSEKSSKGRMVKKRLMLEAQFCLPYLRGDGGKPINENIRWLVGPFLYIPICI